eukprot:UN25353
MEIDKRTEQCVKFVVFSFLFVLGFMAQNWNDWLDVPSIWSYLDETNPKQIDGLARYYFFLELGWYGHRTVTAPFEYNRSDFWEMFLHHLVTSTVIVNAYVCGAWKAGVMIMLIHDPSDALLAFTKSCHYLGFSLMADIGFGIFTLSWAISRVYIFPVYLVYSCPMALKQMSDKYDWCDNMIDCLFHPDTPAKYSLPFFGTCLCGVLFFLHVYWMYLILNVLVHKIIFKKLTRCSKWK